MGRERQDAANRIRAALIRRELARRDYGAYLQLVHGPAWIPTCFSAFLAREVQAFAEADTGNAYDILILETPPQHGKSMTVTESLPSWILMKRPDTRIILGSYNDESAERFARRNREKLETWGKALSGIALGVNRAKLFEIAGRRGRLLSVGIQSGVTGNPAEVLIIDDPVKNREEADSQAYREKLWGEWVNSFKSRLQAKAKVIVIMTPWHEDDLASRILRTERNVRLIRLPVEAEPSEREPDPLGRQAGEPLCPELGKGAKWLAQFREAYLNDPSGGQRAWMALYQCRPRAEDGNIVRREWWKYYDAAPQLPLLYMSVDAAFKGGDNNDFVAVTVWGKRGNDYFLLDCINRHLDFVGTLAVIRETKKRFPAIRAVLIEDKANGSAIINVLQREMYCIPVNPEGDKMSRVYGVSPAIESGHVALPRSAPWLEEYLNQWTAFPHGKHDDMVDSSSQALVYLEKIRVPAPLTDAQRRQAREDAQARAGLLEGNLYQRW